MLALPVQGTPLSDLLQHHPIAAVTALFGAGLATSLTPCIYPMIPITAGIISGTAEQWGGAVASQRRVALLTLTYVAGLALFYALLGAIAGATGQLFGTISANPWVRFAVANLLLLFGLAMLDVFPVQAPQRLVAWAARLTGGSYPAVFLLGATSGIVAAPCGAPAFAVVLTWVGATHSAVAGFFYLFVFSLGMTVLLVAVGLFSGLGASLPKAGPWMAWIKKAAGVVLIGVAEYYLIQVGKTL